MNYKYLILSLFLIVGIFFAGCTEQQVNEINADEIAKKMQEKYESMKSMEADVLITMNIMGQTKTMQYKYAFEKPNKFYMENDEFLMVCDGKTYYTYNKKTNQYTMMEIKGEENDIFSPDYGKFIKSMLKNFNVSYLGEEHYNGRKCYVLELIPKENPEEKMKMYVDEEYWQPLKIEMEGMSIEYKNVKFNVDIPDERFKFTPPEGAKLMSSGKMTMSKDIDEVQKDEERNLEKILETFLKELEEKKVLESRDRVFFGSARAHLQRLGVVEGTSSLDRLKELGIPTGIEELKNALVEYNRTERIKVLERRIENLFREVKSFLSEAEVRIKGELKKGDFYWILPKEYSSLRRKAVATIERDIDILHERIKRILDSKEISKNLKEKLQKEIIFPSQEVIEKKKKEVSSQISSTEEHPDTLNWELRKWIKRKLNESFGLAVEESVGEEIERFKNEVIEIFIKALSPSEKDREELMKRVESFLEENCTAPQKSRPKFRKIC